MRYPSKEDLSRSEQLVRLLYEYITQMTGISTQDIEITIIETPRHNWDIRGLPGDEVKLSYNVEV